MAATSRILGGGNDDDEEERGGMPSLDELQSQLDSIPHLHELPETNKKIKKTEATPKLPSFNMFVDVDHKKRKVDDVAHKIENDID